MNKYSKGFTLIEILISMAIIGTLATIATFGIRGARESARDAKRQTDLQNLKTSLEFFYSDCGYYPVPNSNAVPSPLTGDDGNSRCLSSNTYMSDIPSDPQPTLRSYYYDRPTSTSYILCASLEEPPTPADDVTGCAALTDCGLECNLQVSGP